MRQYIEKQTRDYWKQENVASEILGGKLVVREPSHTLTDYLSPFLLSYFDLEVFLEKEDPAAKKFKGFEKYPRILLVKYRKKNPH